MNFSILIVDDDPDVCRTLSKVLTSKGYTCYTQTDPTKVLEDIKSFHPDLAIVDIKMPRISGLDLLPVMKKAAGGVPVIIVSGHATIDDAVKAMKYGVLNIFTKPLKLPLFLKEIEQVARNAERKQHIITGGRLITVNQEMKKLLRLAEIAAPTDAAVIITGESGTGKELIADVLKRMSSRRDKPYIKINCAAIPEPLIESEMFGHEKGAFTDAKTRNIGKFERAADGTVFLDEIGDMSLRIQAKMLRVLQEKTFSRIGSSHLIKTNCRIIAATNKDLPSMIKTGEFREDLYYRLSVITLHVPSLRNRMDDIMPVTEYFLDYFNELYRKNVWELSREVKELLLSYSWPGNVRELKNFIERAVIFSESRRIDLSIIPEQYQSLLAGGGKENGDSGDYYDKARNLIVEALRESHGKKQEAARLLNISRKTLYNRMKKLNIQ